MLAGSPQRVLFIAERFWPELTGCGPIILNLARMLRSEGHYVTVLAARPHFPERCVWPDYMDGQYDRQHVDGIEVFRVPFFPFRTGGFADRLLTESLMAAAFLKRLWLERIGEFDTVISLCPSTLSVLCGSLIQGAGRHIALVHDIQSGLAESLGMGPSRGLLAPIRWLERLSFNRADAIITLSNAMAQALRSNAVSSPIYVVPPQIDIGAIRPLPVMAEHRYTILYSGNLGRKQGVEQVLDMAAVLKRELPPARIVVRGTGNREEQLRKQARTMRLTNLTFEPLMPAGSLSEALASGAIHLVPQRATGAEFAVPSKLYSIMAAARPAVCTAVAGSPLHELMLSSGAFLCTPPDDPQQFAATVAALLTAPERQVELGRRGLNYVRAHLAPGTMKAKLAEIIGSAALPASHGPAGARTDSRDNAT